MPGPPVAGPPSAINVKLEYFLGKGLEVEPSILSRAMVGFPRQRSSIWITNAGLPVPASVQVGDQDYPSSGLGCRIAGTPWRRRPV